MTNVGEAPSLDEKDPRFRTSAFGVDSEHHKEEVRKYQVQKALAMINSSGQQITPPEPVVEKPPIDLSKFPPPHPSDREQ